MENAVVKARGDADAARSRAVDLTEGYISRRPYLNLQNISYLGTSSYLSAEPWRRVLYSSPTVWACVKALSDQLVALPWHVTTKDKSQRHAKKALIDYYTEEVIGQFNGENYDTGVMRMNRDVLTIPQGGNAEVVRKIAGKWNGEVDRVENIDGGTLRPTGSPEYPLIQRDPTNATRPPIVFEKDQVRRVLMNPRPEYNATGYQQSPLEMCYLAIDALSKGDFYYLNLLTDTPSAGILDLADWTKEEAVTWAKSWRELLTGNDALKIPLVYEHEKPVGWIPFGVPPEQMMLPDVLQHYTRLVHSCFSLYTQDTGLTEQMAGGRETNLERRSWHRFNALIALWENFWNSIVNPILVFKYEEVNIEETERLARAMVAKANALGILARGNILGIKEVRREISETGMIETYINTEELPEDVVPPAGFGGGINPVVAGQSRWQEQRLPEEGRKQALPAPKREPREEERQRIRPKSLANAENLTGILSDAFQKIADDVPDITQLIKDAGVVLISALKEAKSFTENAYARWLDEFDILMDNEENSLIKAKALVRKRRQSTKIIEDLLKSNRWWDVNNPELFEQARKAFKAAYEDALDEFAEEVQQALYEEGYADSSTAENYAPSLVNLTILGEIDSYAQRMMDNLNQGSQYYLKHALSRAITSQLSKPEYRQRIHDDEDAALIIASVGFVDDVAQAFKAELVNLVAPRAERAAWYELGNIEGSARLQAMKGMGLGNKQWNTWGPNPCDVCIANAALGPVPLDYEYQSVFGTCRWTPAHPFENCGITFDRAELRAIIDSGGELTLYRGW